MAEKEGRVDPRSGKSETTCNSCVTCGSTENIKQCAKCLSVAYCSKEHQVQDWKKHRKNCKKLLQNGKQNDDRSPITHSTSSKETNQDSKLDQSASINLTFEFDKRPYKPRNYPQPTGKDLVSLAEHVTSQLKSNNFCVVDSIFNPTLANEVLKEVIEVHSSGIFIDGQLSGGRRNSSDTIVTKKTIRGDEITWLEGNEKQFPYICMLVKTLDKLLSKMNIYLKGECDVGGRTKAMVACYPGNGTGYACHVDNPNRDGRCITCLFYLNEGWDVRKNGGLLRLFQGSDDYIDVEPILNRAIFFWSDRRNPHEVQPAFKTRYAITVWYLDKHERLEARKAANTEDVSRLQQQYSMMNLSSKSGEKDESEGEKREVPS
ncbi:prolyl hydroxylase EGLN3-like [Lytechinus variegatus]|uniref:prolyl hydroxylase EGLN3-like n=1 Tax=Lytechinus variegatus TaxID=7654 RepID=UPI001BB1D67C|nr:prolyl hydroxylase EGLN3-like [Lytechinus variegatus]